MLPKEVELKRFFGWINERHRIYLKKEAGEPPPWTGDPILQRHRFCCVFRELDRTTKWIRENWREPYADHQNLWFAMALARQINRTETLAEIGFPKRWNPERIVKIIESRRAQGLKAYTGAYMLTGTLGGKKSEQTAYKILDVLYRNPPSLAKKPCSSLEDAWAQFKGRPGFGGFLAYEVVSDLRHTRYLCNAADTMTWANPGPGAIRGLHRLHGRRIKGRNLGARLTRERAISEMRALLEVSPQYLEPHVPPLEMREIEHCLCEMDKMLRVQLGQGVLAIYRPYSPNAVLL